MSSRRSDNPGSAAFAAVHRVFKFLSQLCILLAGIGLVAMVLIFGWEVYGRYILNDTPTWTGQLGLVLIVYIVCFGAAAGIYQNTHLQITFLRENLPRIPRAMFEFVSDVIVIAFGIMMAWQGLGLTLANSNHVLAMLDITASWRAAPLIFCGALIALFSVFGFIERVFVYIK